MSNQSLSLSFEKVPVEIECRDGGTRRFTLIEHTGAELDQWILDNSQTYEQAREELTLLQQELQTSRAQLEEHLEQTSAGLDAPLPDLSFRLEEEDLLHMKERIAIHSAQVVAGILHPSDGLERPDPNWVMKNLSRRSREKLISMQNDLDGLEVISKDAGFLLERGILISLVQIRQAKGIFQSYQQVSSAISSSSQTTEIAGESSP